MPTNRDVAKGSKRSNWLFEILYGKYYKNVELQFFAHASSLALCWAILQKKKRIINSYEKEILSLIEAALSFKSIINFCLNVKVE